MIDALVVAVGFLALIPALLTVVNLRLLRTPPRPAVPPRIAVLVPARDEEANIGACLDAVLASKGVHLEVIVLDDGSRDRTAAIVRERAMRDPRVRLEAAPALPPGWRGKPHACHVLSTLTDRPFLLFVDADVRLQPEGAARLVPPDNADMVSGVPQQRFGSVLEAAVIPMINSLIFGYLPVALMRSRLDPSLAAACGQMICVRTTAYRASGGHAAIPMTSHDGLLLPRLFRHHGFRTDLVDGTRLATCRMYETPKALFAGFGKNATEGMAKPVALPVWTMLLAGGHILPFVLIVLELIHGAVARPPGLFLCAATALLVIARVAQGRRTREPIWATALHPIGVALTLFIQWRALIRSFTGGTVEWRGRSYAPLS